jgi:hypothetical protein
MQTGAVVRDVDKCRQGSQRWLDADRGGQRFDMYLDHAITRCVVAWYGLIGIQCHVMAIVIHNVMPYIMSRDVLCCNIMSCVCSTMSLCFIYNIIMLQYHAMCCSTMSCVAISCHVFTCDIMWCDLLAMLACECATPCYVVLCVCSIISCRYSAGLTLTYLECAVHPPMQPILNPPLANPTHSTDSVARPLLVD